VRVPRAFDNASLSSTIAVLIDGVKIKGEKKKTQKANMSIQKESEVQQRRGLLMQVIMHVRIGIGPDLPDNGAHRMATEIV
jgi:hypothetical protein